MNPFLLLIMQKGEIWSVALPDVDGHEQVGRRPAIVLADTDLPVVIIVPCTANMQALRFPFTMLLETSKSNGLEVASVALIFHLRAIDRKRLMKKIGFVGKLEMGKVKRIIRDMLDL